jgi:hypothetical protein
MSTSTSAFFPLATEAPVDDGAPEYNTPGSDTGTERGASGESTNNVGISKGGLVAIVVVVVAVGVIGSECEHPGRVVAANLPQIR